MITTIKEFMEKDNIRISCAALARIIIDDKYLLCMNKNHAQNGRQVYTPLGGGLQYDNQSLEFLNSLNVKLEREEPDLRFTMNINNVQTFEQWFSKRIGREISIDRELYEELVDEEMVLPSLSNSQYSSKFIKIVLDLQKYDDKYADMRNALTTYRFFEIYEVQFNDELTKILREECNNGKIALLSRQEIQKGMSDSNIKIGANTKSLL